MKSELAQVSGFFKRLPRRVVLATAAMLLFSPSLFAQQSGSTPYAALYQALKPALEVRRFDRLRAVANVQSKTGAVSPDQIRMEIRARAGSRRLAVAASGDFDFPLDEALLSENPNVVSNQPKGSLTLSVTVMLRPFPTLRVPYREILAALSQAQQFVASDPQQQGIYVRGVELNFAPGKVATVAVRGRSEQLLMADEFGRVVLTDASEWHKPDVDVEFSEMPLRILPYLDVKPPQ